MFIRKTSVVLSILMLSSLLFSCSKNTHTKEVIIPEGYKPTLYDKVIIGDTEYYDYSQAILEMIDVYSSDEHKVNKWIEKYQDICTINLINKMNESSMKYVSVEPDLDVVIEKEETEEEYIEVEDDNGNLVKLYPIYDMTGNIYDYGTKEDSEGSKVYVQSIPLYSILSYDVYSNYAVLEVRARVGSNLKIVVSLDDNKMNDFTIYR